MQCMYNLMLFKIQNLNKEGLKYTQQNYALFTFETRCRSIKSRGFISDVFNKPQLYPTTFFPTFQFSFKLQTI